MLYEPLPRVVLCQGLGKNQGFSGEFLSKHISKKEKKRLIIDNLKVKVKMIK